MIRALAYDIRNIGFAGWFAYVIDRSLSLISRGAIRFTALWFYAQPVEQISTIKRRDEDRIRTELAGPGQVPDASFGRPLGAIPERFEQGSTCIAAFNGDQLAGFMWLQFESLRERLVRCDFVPLPQGRASWDFDVFVAPPFRMGRTFGRLWSHAKSYLQERGIETTLSWVAFDNMASRRAHERMGARRVGWALILTVGKAQLLLASTSPYIHFSVSEANRPKVLVQAPKG